MSRPVRRHPDWLHRLASAIQEGARRPFSYGQWDCCIAACKTVQAIIDLPDPVEPFRYSSKASATLAMRRYIGARLDHADLLPAVAEKRATELGLAEVPRLYAQRGDFVIVQSTTPDGERPALAIVGLAGTHAYTAALAGGWVDVPMSRWLRVWRV